MQSLVNAAKPFRISNADAPTLLLHANAVGEDRGKSTASHFLRKGAFGHRVLTLMSAIVVAQVLSVLAAPILSRLYDPAAFGVYAMYTTVLMLSAPFVCGRYELAIVPADTDDEAFGLLLISCVTAVLFGVVTLLALQEYRALAFLGLKPIAKYSIAVAISAVLNGLFPAFVQYWIRETQFRKLAVSQIVRSVAMTGGQVSIAEINPAGASGMIIGQMGGIALSILILGRTLPSRFASWKTRHRGEALRTLRTLAVRHRNHPIFLPWGGLVDALGHKLPVLMLSVFYGPVFLGMYSLADRLLKTPSMLIGESSAQVLFQKMTEPDVKARMPRLIAVWALGMTLLAVLPFTLLHFFSRPLFTFALGKQWALAGSIAAVLIPIYWGGLVVSPISNLLVIGNRQALSVLIQVLFLVVGFGSLWIGHRIFSDGVQTLRLYSIAQWCVYVIYYAALIGTAKLVARKQTEWSDQCAV
ncbi:MAG: oligosaccharide flippase family protein [Acidobacteriaceae bacterium]|nr:oligosaccharide flippase family protein [Acidobacteriaceae bacterium]